MKVLHVSTATTWRGGEQQIAYLMEESARSGLDVGLFCAEGSAIEKYARQNGIKVMTFRKRMSFDPIAARYLRRVSSEQGYHLLHFHDSHAHSLGVLSASLFGNPLPLIVSRRVDFPPGSGALARWKYLHPSVRAYICVSEKISEVMRGGGMPAERLHVVHSGVDLSRFEGRGDERLRKEYNVPEGVPLIANISAIAPHKDYRTFVETADRFLSNGGEGRFFIIGGDGGEEEEIKKLVEDKGLDESIIFTGFRTDIEQILPSLDLFLITSKTEGLGTTILDAFAAGVPVVATDGGGIPEIVRHRETGMLARVGDAGMLANHIGELLASPAERQRLRTNARELVHRFSKEKTAVDTIAIYRGVIGG